MREIFSWSTLLGKFGVISSHKRGHFQGSAYGYSILWQRLFWAPAGSAGRGWGTSAAGMTCWPLFSIWDQQRFALAPVIMQGKAVFKNKLGSRHWPSSPSCWTRWLWKQSWEWRAGARGRHGTAIPLIQTSFPRSTNLRLSNTFLG